MTGTDDELLRWYAAGEARGQAAFAVLVQRHLNLVYSAALRQVRSPHLAEEIAQSVFTDLARQAHRLRRDTPIVAWLHLVTRRTAVDTIRTESRRRAREAAAAELRAIDDTRSSPWQTLEPVLDEAVASLSSSERTAILLRFFENKSLRAVGAAFGINEDAAQKRVSRALERLRTLLARRGVVATSGSLATQLSTSAVHAAPVSLLAQITTHTAAASVAATGAGVAGFFAMTTLQKAIAAAAAVVVSAAGLGGYAHLAQTRAEINALEHGHEKSVRELRDLESTQRRSEDELVSVEAKIDRRLAAAPAADLALTTRMDEWLARMDRVRRFLQERPQWNIPELALLRDEEWYSVVPTKPLDSDDDLRPVTAELRNRAVNAMINHVREALNRYLIDHDGALPVSVADLGSYLDPKANAAWLDRYEMLEQGRLQDLTDRQRLYALIGMRAPADPDHDHYWRMGTSGGSVSGALSHNLRHAQQAYANAHGGERAMSAAALLPYLKWPADVARVQEALNEQAQRKP